MSSARHQSQTSSEFILIENDVFHSRVIIPFANSTQLFFLSVIYKFRRVTELSFLSQFSHEKGELCALLLLSLRHYITETDDVLHKVAFSHGKLGNQNPRFSKKLNHYPICSLLWSVSHKETGYSRLASNVSVILRKQELNFEEFW